MRLFLLALLNLMVRCPHGFTLITGTTRESIRFIKRKGPSHKQCCSCNNRLSPPLPTRSLPKRVYLTSSNTDVEEIMEEEEDDAAKAAKKADKLLGILVLLTVPLSWGTYAPVVRYLYAIQPPVPGFVFSACYYAVAAITTSSLALWQSRKSKVDNDVEITIEPPTNGIPFVAGMELGAYLFIANCLQVIGLRTVESDRAGFLVQLTTVMVPFVEALFAGTLAKVHVRTWFACVFALIGLFVMSLDGRIIYDPISSFMTTLSLLNRGDLLIIGAAVLYTLHVVRLGEYAKETTPMRLAASKATAEAFFSILLVGGLAALSSIQGEQTGVLGFAIGTGKEISSFFVSFRKGLSDGSLPSSVLLPAVGAVFWTGWITCAYTIYAQSFGQSRVTPTNANLIYTFQPIFTALFGWLLLGETMGPYGFVGGAIIASSVYMVASANLGDSKDSGNGETKEKGYQEESVANGNNSKHSAFSAEITER